MRPLSIAGEAPSVPAALTDQPALPSSALSVLRSPCAPATTTSPSTTAGLETKGPAEGLAFHATENGAPDFSSLARPRPSASPRDGQSFANAAGEAPRKRTAANTRPTVVVVVGACLLTDMWPDPRCSA